jgi:hypothetical protein
VAVIWRNTFDNPGLVASDTFTRTVASGWGTADTGQGWALAGGTNSERQVSGGVGSITLPADPANIRINRLPDTVVDAEVLLSITPDQLAIGASFFPGILLRYVDGSNFYRCRFEFRADGTVHLQVVNRSTLIIGGVDTGLTYSAGTKVWLRARIDGQVVRGRAWIDGTAEPGTWTIERTITTNTIDAGQVGVTASASASITNVSPRFDFDGFAATGEHQVTVANSAAHGDALSSVAGIVRYSTEWSAAGAASVLIGADESTSSAGVDLGVPSQAAWSLRAYVYAPPLGYQQCYADWASGLAWNLDPEFGVFEIGEQDVSAHAAALTDVPLRIEVAVTGGTAEFRVWWTDPHSTGPPDWSHSGPDTGWGPTTYVQFVGNGTTPAYLDEVALAQGEWIGPAIIHGTTEGTLALSGTVSGYKRALGAVEGDLAAGSVFEGAPRASALGRLSLSGEVSGHRTGAGEVAGGLVLSGTVSGHKIVYGTVEGSLALSGAIVQLVNPVPALSTSATPIGRLAATATRR